MSKRFVLSIHAHMSIYKGGNVSSCIRPERAQGQDPRCAYYWYPFQDQASKGNTRRRSKLAGDWMFLY